MRPEWRPYPGDFLYVWIILIASLILWLTLAACAESFTQSKSCVRVRAIHSVVEPHAVISTQVYEVDCLTGRSRLVEEWGVDR